MTLFDAKAVTMTFGGLTAVNKVDFTIEKGMIASLIGPNGAGKTTFFNTITRIYTPTSGEITFDGINLQGLKPFNITKIGIARTFQNIRLFANMTALENVLVGQHTHLKSNLIGQILHLPSTMQEEAEARTRGLDMLEFVGLRRTDANVTAKNLSYGLQRRLEIARALASNPKLLLLDEPSLGLAPIVAAHIMRIIHKIRDDGLTILLVEQNAQAALELGDYGYVIETGRVVLEDKAAALLQNDRVKEAYLG